MRSKSTILFHALLVLVVIVTLAGCEFTVTQGANGSVTVTTGNGNAQAGAGTVAAPVAADSYLDTSFGNHAGIELSTYQGAPIAMALQADGKIVFAGIYAYLQKNGTSGSNFSIGRFNADGSPDSTFGGGYLVMPGESSIAQAVAIQTDGKIVAAGCAVRSGKAFAILVRYNSDGTRDSSFGVEGIVRIQFGPARNESSDITSLAIQADGKLVIAGISSVPHLQTERSSLARLNPDGNMDSTFGDGGIVAVALGPTDMQHIALQPDGKILVGRDNKRDTVFVSRYDSAGILDQSFGQSGVAKVSSNAISRSVSSILLQDDGKILLGGMLYPEDGHGINLSMLIRFNDDGSLDDSFGNDGEATMRYQTEAGQILQSALQPDGKIVQVGFARDQGGHKVGFVVIRCLPDGSADNSFGNGGQIRSTFQSNASLTTVAIQPDGKIVAGGSIQSDDKDYFSLVRYLQN